MHAREACSGPSRPKVFKYFEVSVYLEVILMILEMGLIRLVRSLHVQNGQDMSRYWRQLN